MGRTPQAKARVQRTKSNQGPSRKQARRKVAKVKHVQQSFISDKWDAKSSLRGNFKKLGLALDANADFKQLQRGNAQLAVPPSTLRSSAPENPVVAGLTWRFRSRVIGARATSS
eukprot:m.12604 g.12604  ORF g.12604 m.12604 type:complete len:114 (-) comp17573_c0_seq2:444-785(-)